MVIRRGGVGSDGGRDAAAGDDLLLPRDRVGLMECPQCEGELATYALGESVAVHCERCGYVGIEADHRPKQAGEPETWAEAVERFRRGR